MALELSARAELLSRKTNIEQQIVLCIDGIPLCFGAQAVLRFWRIGDEGVKIGNIGLKIGGLIGEENSRAYFSLNGSTNSITQQLDIEQGGSGSITKFNVNLIDKNQELTRLFTPGQTVTDLLGREATVYFGFANSSFPDDFIVLFNGIIDQTNASPGSWKITIAHPQVLTNVDLFTKKDSSLNGAIDSSQSSIVLVDSSNLLLPQDTIRTAVQIEDEIIEYTGISGNTLTGCVRGIEGTVANSHDNEEEVSSVYIVEDRPINLALKVMLSTQDKFYVDNLNVGQFVRIDTTTTIQDAIQFFNFNLQNELGIVVGDIVTVTGASEAANNVIDAPITNITQNNFGTVLILGGAGLVEELDTSAVVKIKSKYDVFPVTIGGVSAGCNMKAKQVDVGQHERFEELLSSSQPDYKFLIKETVKAKDFLVNEVYRPAGFFQIPRKGAYSIGATLPPLVLDTLAQIGLNQIKNPGNLAINRSLGRNFFNTIIYKFNEDSLESGKFLAGEILFSQRSINRIPTGSKSLNIESRGMRDDVQTRNFITRQSRRYNDRYQFASESVQIETLYKDGFDVEIGDTVLFGEPALQLPDSNTATRNFVPRLMEVQQKTMDLKQGKISLTLVDMGFGLDGRFGVVSPSSFVDADSTNSVIYLQKSFTTGEFENERDKWSDFILENIIVHSVDWSFIEEVKLQAFDNDSTNGIIIDPPLSVSPPSGYLVNLPYYPNDTDSSFLNKMKQIHCFFNPQVEILSGPTNTQFEVGAADIDKFLVGAFVRVHNESYSVQSITDLTDDDLVVTNVDDINNIVTVDRDMGFSPLAGYQVDLIGFPDAGTPYRIL